MVVLFRESRKMEGGKGLGGRKSLNQDFCSGRVESEKSVNYLCGYVKQVTGSVYLELIDLFLPFCTFFMSNLLLAS